ncbi:hypothetical protein BLNAU_11464 [Blattamonas nauphoetae]|uniref:Uncharacterized protein n=1 Tax=Blattamonas nauphoetae TaxID=2049346 RepID=A0ABQ9XQ25_9EUKA|nr:hypothetical protein BLNAU_11464 [Blattamonas nauphoetae]
MQRDSLKKMTFADRTSHLQKGNCSGASRMDDDTDEYRLGTPTHSMTLLLEKKPAAFDAFLEMWRAKCQEAEAKQ